MSCSMCNLPTAEPVRYSGLRTGDCECPFCFALFSRVDGARRHAKRCPQRGARVLQPRKRGRKARSCDHCSRVKTHCDAAVHIPCTHCNSRKLACTFSGYCNDIAHRQSVDMAQVESLYSNGDRVSVSFLLNSTDDKLHFVTESAVGKEPDGGLLGPICVPPSEPGFLIDATPDYIDPTLLLPSECQWNLLSPQLSTPYNVEEPNLLGTLQSPRSHEDRLAARIQLLESHVVAYARSRARYRDSFDTTSFRRLFSVNNVYMFAQIFCCKRHYRYPIIHWGTFGLEETSLPLLMVVTLTGACYSYRPGYDIEHVNNARSLFALADSYIFHQLDTYIDRSPPAVGDSEAIQLYQAALLMYGLDTLSAGDVAMQRTAIAYRLPALVSAMRRLEFPGCRHGVSEDWQLFLHREHIIRLVAWTFCADCLATLSCNNPPLISVFEMTGDLPCDPILWDTDSELGFELLKHSMQWPPHSLKCLMLNFLGEIELDVDQERLPLFHLHIILCGFQQIIFNLHTTMVLAARADKLLQAFSKWRYLWGRAIEKAPKSHRTWLGVARHIPEIEFLSRRVIEVAISPEAKSSRYLQRLPSHDTGQLHEFIRDFVAGSS